MNSRLGGTPPRLKYYNKIRVTPNVTTYTPSLGGYNVFTNLRKTSSGNIAGTGKWIKR